MCRVQPQPLGPLPWDPNVPFHHHLSLSALHALDTGDIHALCTCLVPVPLRMDLSLPGLRWPMWDQGHESSPSVRPWQRADPGQARKVDSCAIQANSFHQLHPGPGTPSISMKGASPGLPPAVAFPVRPGVLLPGHHFRGSCVPHHRSCRLSHSHSPFPLPGTRPGVTLPRHCSGHVCSLSLGAYHGDGLACEPEHEIRRLPTTPAGSTGPKLLASPGPEILDLICLMSCDSII